MAHVREGIRKAIVTAVTGRPTTGANVFNWSLYAQGEDVLPSLEVRVGEGQEVISGTVENQFGSGEVRDLPVSIIGRAVKSSTDVALLDTIDDICVEVEIVMAFPSGVLAGLVVDSMLISTEIEMVGDGERPVATVTMEWLIRYEVDRTNPVA